MATTNQMNRLISDLEGETFTNVQACQLQGIIGERSRVVTKTDDQLLTEKVAAMVKDAIATQMSLKNLVQFLKDEGVLDQSINTISNFKVTGLNKVKVKYYVIDEAANTYTLHEITSCLKTN